MPKALIKGETHLSTKDKQALLELDLGQFDAIFREGHETDHFDRDISLVYALFAIGHLVYGATYGKFYTSSEEFKQHAHDQGVPFYDEIDAAVYETYSMIPRWKRIVLLLISPFFAGIILGLITTPFRWVVNEMLPGLIPLLGVIAAIGLIFLFGFAWALAYFLLIESEAMYDRDDVMAENIISIAEEEGYETILVSCGGNHRSGIASTLEDEGWDVDERTTDSWIGKILLWIDRVIEGLLAPIQTTRDLLSNLRNSGPP